LAGQIPCCGERELRVCFFVKGDRHGKNLDGW
jgi:hypothetical protein